MNTTIKVTKKNMHEIEKKVPVDVFLRIKEIQLMNEKYEENTEIVLGEPEKGLPEYIKYLASGYKEMLILNNNSDGTVYIYKYV